MYRESLKVSKHLVSHSIRNVYAKDIQSKVIKYICHFQVEMNPVYGVYYSSGGSQVDQGEAEVHDANDYYYQS